MSFFVGKTEVLIKKTVSSFDETVQ